MGSTCAGAIVPAGKRFSVRIKKSSARAQLATGTCAQSPGVAENVASITASKREAVRKIKEDRRRLFEERKPFQCGVLSKARQLLMYIPAGDGVWQENLTGKVISHERLQEYLKRYQFI
jgi:hypothetical protein